MITQHFAKEKFNYKLKLVHISPPTGIECHLQGDKTKFLGKFLEFSRLKGRYSDKYFIYMLIWTHGVWWKQCGLFLPEKWRFIFEYFGKYLSYYIIIGSFKVSFYKAIQFFYNEVNNNRIMMKKIYSRCPETDRMGRRRFSIK